MICRMDSDWATDEDLNITSLKDAIAVAKSRNHYRVDGCFWRVHPDDYESI